MAHQPDDEVEAVLKPLASLISKSEKAQTKLAPGTWQHAMLEDNLKALRVGHALVSADGECLPSFPPAQLEDALTALASMIERTENTRATFAPGTSQHTLQRNRLHALRTAQEATRAALERETERALAHPDATRATDADTAPVDEEWTPVTHESHDHVQGPFYHGTKSHLQVGELLVPGMASNFEEGRISNNLYFTAALETAVWGAELATALTGAEGRGHIYVVEPLGTFEDDPNVTNKRFPGNPTKSYRTREPLRIVGEVEDWEGHSPEVLGQMLEAIEDLRRKGLAVIED